MAKIQFSAAVGDARNKAGGVVFTKNRFGSVIRRKVSPVQPRSAAVRNVRASFTSFSKAWGSILTNAQRAAWIALANANPQHDVFGNTVILTGLQMYQLVNRNLATIGVARLDDAPASLSAGFPGATTLTAVSGGTPSMSVTTANDPAANEVPVIYAAAALSPGRAFVGSATRYLFQAAAATAGPYDILAAYTARFGALISGKSYNILVKFIANDTGAAGTPSAAQVNAT